MSPADKLAVMSDLIRTGLELREAGIRALHPELTRLVAAGLTTTEEVPRVVG